ncbi:autotransporter domain-containing protein [Stappia sp.]|uniref:autotransporter domain-containing protein n=1 Tax=Stappia sp. TaxID=1870903 RepID=UPI003A9979F5
MVVARRNGNGGRVLRAAMAHLLCSVAVLGALSGAAGAQDAQKDGIRVLTFNTWGDGSNSGLRADPTRMSDFFLNGDYDVIGLQESTSGAYRSALLALLPSLGLGTYDASQRDDASVLSRLQGSVGSLKDLVPGSGYDRFIGYAALDAQKGMPKMGVGSVHFDYHDEPAVRVAEAKGLNAIAKGVTNPLLIVGDFNAGDVSERGLHSAEQASYLFARVLMDGGSSQLWKDLAGQYTPEGREVEFQAYVADMRSGASGSEKYRQVIADYFDAHRADYPGASDAGQLSWRQWEEIIAKDMAGKGLTFEDETYAVDANLPVTMNVLKKDYILLQNESERELFQPIEAGDGRTTWTSKGEDHTNTWTSWDHVKIDHFIAARPFGKWMVLDDDPNDSYTGVLTETAFSNDGSRQLSDHELVAHTVRWVGPVLQDLTPDGAKKRIIWGAAANTFDEAGGVFHLTRNNRRTDVYLGQISDADGNPILTGLSEAEKKTLLDCSSQDAGLQASIQEYCIDDHTFIGETVVSDNGTVIVDEDAALGLASADLRLVNGRLRIAGTAMTELNRKVGLDAVGRIEVEEAANTVSLAQGISGVGVLVKEGAGTLSLEAANSYAGGTVVEAGRLTRTLAGGFVQNTAYEVNGGTLDLGGFDLAASRLSGTGGAIALGGSSLGVDQSANTRFDGVISGTGGLTKSGTGALVLNGQNTYTGTTRVDGGWLVVGDADHATASLAGTVSLGSGGQIGGAGTLGALALDNGAVLAPGNSIGTLKVAGDLSFSSGSIFKVEIDATGAGDRVEVGGAATLGGATVDITKAVGSYGVGQRYTILTATGGVSGTFGNLTQNLPFLDLTLAYDPNELHLDVLRNTASFDSIAATGNQQRTANAVEALGVGNVVYDAVARQASDTSARATFDALSGEMHASVRTALINDSLLLRSAANDRIRAAFAETSAPNAVVATHGAAATPARAGSGLWGTALGGWSSTSANGNAARMTQTTGGFVAGIDGEVSDSLRIGVMGGFTRSTFDVSARSSSGNTETAHVGVYGGGMWNGAALRGGAAFSWHTMKSSRSVVAPGLVETLSADHSARTFQAFGELAYEARVEAAVFEPFANLAFVQMRTDGFSETGGSAALSVAGANDSVTFTTVGLRASTPLSFGDLDLMARGMVGWQHAFGDVSPTARMAFAGGGAFDVTGTPVAGDVGLVEIGADALIGSRARAGLSYAGQFGSGLSQSTVKARLAISF